MGPSHAADDASTLLNRISRVTVTARPTLKISAMAKKLPTKENIPYVFLTLKTFFPVECVGPLRLPIEALQIVHPIRKILDFIERVVTFVALHFKFFGITL